MLGLVMATLSSLLKPSGKKRPFVALANVPSIAQNM